MKHLHDFIGGDQTKRHLLDYILSLPPTPVAMDDKKILEAPQGDGLESKSNNHNQDQNLSSPRHPSSPTSDNRGYDKDEVSSSEEKSPDQVEQQALLRRSLGLDSPPAARIDARQTHAPCQAQQCLRD